MLWFFVFLAVVFVSLELGRAVSALSGPVGNEPTDPAIKRSAFLVPLIWMACAPLAFASSRDVRDYRRRERILTRSGWAWACSLCLLHVTIAFHLGHAWSHEAAWEHTRRAGGYGYGVYVNYAFALVWLTDAIWLCVAFDSYFTRPRWLHWAIHGFLAFVVFNAAFVFATTGARVWFIGWALLLASMAWAARFRRRARANEARTAAPTASPESGGATDAGQK
ncbi:MAG: hypothetical protein J0I06_10035 [Planctomycetes bacterium]|nr:hypothetical protein [Planctomycetota bacterium]